MDTRASTGARLSVLPLFIAFILNIFLVAPVTPLTASPAGPSTAYADSHVTVTLEEGVAGCMGVRTTPGSENTTKELVGGTLEPGGTAVFRFTFPAEAGGNPGQEEWELTDCVFLNDTPIQKYTVTALSNDVSPVIIQFALTIPSDAPIGSEYCNYAKTTQTPSDAQASNRKAGPACFIVGGAIRVLKVDTATPPNPLPGATFTVSCQWPNVTDGTFLPDTILSVPADGTIDGGGSTETIDSVDNGSFSRTVVTGSQGVISINGPDGTVCTFTETAAPSGFLPPAAPDNTVVLTIDAGGEQATHTFVNTRALPNVVVAKSASHSTVLAPFSSLEFTLTATNAGNAQATGVTISDQIDTDLAIVSATWDNDPGTAGGTGACSWTAGNLVTCEVGALAASDGDTTGAEPDVATATITVNVPVAACPSVANVATVSATNEGTAEAGDNTSNTVNVTVDCPDASVSKTATDPVILGGETATFSITINGGTLGTASDVTLSETVPAGFSWTVDGDVEDCGLDDGDVLSGGTLISCNFGSLGASEQKTIGVEATTTLVACGATITNTATIAVDGDTATSNNTSTATIDVECPDVAIAKSASSATVLAPGTLEYKLLVTNEGDSTAENVVISDDLDDDLTILGDVKYDLANDGTMDGDCTVAAGNLIECEIGDLVVDATVSVTITVQVSSAACADDLTNTASVAADNEPVGLGGNNDDTVNVTVDCPDVSVEKTAADPVISSTETASFSITVNGGTLGTASDVVLIDTVPSGFSWTVGGDVEDCGLADGDVLSGGTLISCSYGPLEPNEERTISVSAATLATTCELTISNTAEVSTDGDTNTENDASTATVRVECPALEITKTANADMVSAGEPISFWINLGNAGDGTAFDVMLSDALPDGEGISWSILDLWVKSTQIDPADVGDYCAITGTTNQELECDFGDLATGEGAAILIGSATDSDSCAAYPNAGTTWAGNHGELNSLTATVVVECPGLNIVKTADTSPIDAGEEASFTITVWNNGGESESATAFGVMLHDDLPAGLDWEYVVLQGTADCTEASSIEDGGVIRESLDCDLGDLAPSSMEDGVKIRVFAETTRADCGALTNEAWAEATNDDRVEAEAGLAVKCPTITLEKENDAVGSVLPGTTVTYTLILTVDDGPANDVKVVDTLPAGLDDPTDLSDGGVHDATAGTITWSLGDLADGEYTLSYQAAVADAVADGTQLLNVAAATSPNTQCPDPDALVLQCVDDSIVNVRVPTLVLEKEADADLIAITLDGDGNVDAVDPESVTWTLSYTLTDGPVTNAVISDELPDGLVYVDGSATDGGVYDQATNTVTWIFATLSESGSVTFETVVDPETISRTAPSVNVAVISSDQTPEDEGQDQVTVTVEQELGGNPTPTPTPKPQMPDTAIGIGIGGEPVSVPVELLAAAFLASLGGLALVNARTARGRRR